MNTFRQRFFGNSRVVAGLAWLGLVVLVAGAAPLIAAYHPFEIVAQPFLIPSVEHPFGTDSLGRSIWAGLVHGARTTMVIAILATLASVAFGTLAGALAGYFGGLVDDSLMRLTEFFQTIPSFIFAIVLVAILTPSATSLIVAIAVVSWPPIARVSGARCCRSRPGSTCRPPSWWARGTWRSSFDRCCPTPCRPSSSPAPCSWPPPSSSRAHSPSSVSVPRT